MSDEREKEIMECLVHGWIKSECGLYGGLSYQCVCDFLNKMGLPHLAKEVSDHIDALEQKYTAIAKRMGR